MSTDSKHFAWHFLQLMLAVFLLFFLTVGLGKASGELVLYMNNAKIQKSVSEWLIFGIGAPVATATWCVVWIWFKKSEKHGIELFAKGPRNP